MSSFTNLKNYSAVELLLDFFLIKKRHTFVKDGIKTDQKMTE